MARRLFVAGFAGLIAAAMLPISIAQNTSGGKAITKAEIMKGLDAATIASGGGRSVPIVPGFQTLVVRKRVEGPNSASIHSTATDGQDFTEVTEVIDGSGTFMIGGRWVENIDVPYDKRNRSKGITGGASYDAKPGDFFVVPPGTPHWFAKVNKYIIVVETRIPGNALAPAKQ